MLYLGIDQHARQLTISLRNEEGDVLQARQVSTAPEKINAFFEPRSSERLGSDESFIAVLEVCGLLSHPIPEVTASGGKKGWRIAKPGGVYVQFPMQPLLSNGYGDLDVTLQLVGDCSYSSAGTTACQPFPPVPGVNGGISEIVLTHFNIHAKGEKNILHSLDTCHSESADLLDDSILVITATVP